MEQLKALVADDSKVMRLMVMKSLRQSQVAKFECEEACNGAEAVQKFNAGDFDIVFLDINMPEMTGIEAVREIRGGSKNSSVAIVMITSEKTTAKIEEAMEDGGANAYICKPFTVEDMVGTLTPLVNSIGAAV